MTSGDARRGDTGHTVFEVRLPPALFELLHLRLVEEIGRRAVHRLHRRPRPRIRLETLRAETRVLP